MNESAAPWWQAFADAAEKLPTAEQAGAFANLSLQLQSRGHQAEATDYALRAWRMARERGDSQNFDIISRALNKLTPRYHLQISTDAQRITAWQAALASVLRPGMLALEVGSGSGILAMLAARAGADVVSCENDPVIAAIATETVRQNGLAARIQIVGKPVQQLQIPLDLPRPADILLLDLFGDMLFVFEPFDVVSAARRLLRPGAVMVPQQVSLVAALADHLRWPRLMPGRVSGFDMSLLRDLARPYMAFDTGDPDHVLRSAAETILSAELDRDLPAHSGTTQFTLVSKGGPVNGVSVWLRLQLAPGHALEARPGEMPRGFYARANFFPFAEPLATQPGQQIKLGLKWDGKLIKAGLVDGPD